MRSDFVFERIEIGEEMSAHAIGVDHLQRRRLPRHRVFPFAGAILSPALRLIRNAQVAIDLIVEIVSAEKELVHGGEKCPRFRTLNDAMVVCRRHRHHFGDAEIGQHGRIGR